MKDALLLTASALALIPASASAVEWTYASADLSYRSLEVDGDTSSLTSLGGEFEAREGRFTFGGFVDAVLIDDGSDLFYYGASIGYDFTPAFTAYFDIEAVSVTDDLFGDDTFATYTLGGEYETGPYTFGAAVGYAPDSEDDVAYAVYAGYETSPDLLFYASIGTYVDAEDVTYTLGVDYDGSTFDIDGVLFAAPETDLTLVAMSGQYYFNASVDFRVGGQVAYFDIDGDDVVIYGVSAGVEVTDNLWLDAGVSFGDSSTIDDTATIYRIGLEYEIGKRDKLKSRISDAQRAALIDFGY
ncbi:hypothetical protein [Psychromarinibacter sp. S121]|uniref:hypothetical protein n=1 Tax=Psychromarinibacter sp. S121 TaxID=3415127 RepID=UPI003C7B5D73